MPSLFLTTRFEHSALIIGVILGAGAVIALIITFALAGKFNKEIIGRNFFLNSNIISDPILHNRCIRLRYASDENKVLSLNLSDEIIIGRERNCHIIFDDKSISRRHCRIYFTGAVMIENLSKTNGTLVNDNVIDTPVEIIIGDEIKIGLATLVVDSL